MTWYYMPSTSAPGTPDSSSPSDSPASPPAPWLTLSGTATQRPYSWPGWQKRTWIKRLSGLTSTPSTLNRGLDEWTSSLPVSPANRSPLPELDVVLTTSVGSGLPSDGSSVTWDHDSSCWRTSPDLFGPGYPTSSVTLPASGSMRNGVCTQRPRLAHPINVNGSGSWPTQRAANPSRSSSKGTAGPTLNEPACGRDNAKQWPSPKAADGANQSEQMMRGTGLDLGAATAMWGTPVARDDQKTPEAHPAMKQRLLGRTPDAAITSLTVQVKQWPTPTAHDPKDLGAPPQPTGTPLAGTGDRRDRQWPPGRDDTDGWRQWTAQGGPQPALCRSTDGRPAWLADALHAGGNGLVPAVAAAALLELARRLDIDMTCVPAVTDTEQP